MFSFSGRKVHSGSVGLINVVQRIKPDRFSVLLTSKCLPASSSCCPSCISSSAAWMYEALLDESEESPLHQRNTGNVWQDYNRLLFGSLYSSRKRSRTRAIVPSICLSSRHFTRSPRLTRLKTCVVTEFFLLLLSHTTSKSFQSKNWVTFAV